MRTMGSLVTTESQDTGVNTPTLTMSTMGSLVTTESQDTGVNTPTHTMSSMVTTESQDTYLTSHPNDGTLHRAMSPITALGHYYKK
jgi:hypothetical protein